MILGLLALMTMTLASVELQTMLTALEEVSSPIGVDALQGIFSILRIRAHIGVFRQPYLDKIIKGEKTIESRFTKSKVPPFRKVHPNDLILMKESPGSIIGLARVSETKYFGPLLPGQARDVMDKYNQGLVLDDIFRQIKQDSIYVTLIYLDKPILIKPIVLIKSDRRSWISMKYALQLKLF